MIRHLLRGGSEEQSAPLRLLGLVMLGTLTLAPVWVSPVLVTNDGASHLYNAMVAAAVKAQRPPFATYYQVEGGGVRPNQTAQFLLVQLGERLDWEVAERILVTIAIGVTFGVLVLLVARQGLAVSAATAALVTWLSHNWFVWMGLYDFTLSVACYGALLLLLARPLTAFRFVLVQATLALLYLTHFFTFAVAIGLCVVVLAWRAVFRRGPWRALWALAPAALLYVIEVGSGGPGAGSVTWTDPWESLVGLLTGDFVVIAHPVDAIAGVAVMGAAWITVFSRLREVRRHGLGVLSGSEAFGISLLALSVISPYRVGEGWLIPIRLRFLGVVTLLPAMAEMVAQVGVRWRRAAATVLVIGFVAHAAFIVRDSRNVHRDLLLVDRLLTRAGVADGAWVRTRLTTYRRGLFHVAAYRNLVARIAVRRRLVVLDDDEALYGVFATTWRARPDWVTFRKSAGGFTIRLVPGVVRCPPDGVYVLHERERVLQLADSGLELGPTVSEQGFSVTQVKRRG